MVGALKSEILRDLDNMRGDIEKIDRVVDEEETFQALCEARCLITKIVFIMAKLENCYCIELRERER